MTRHAKLSRRAFTATVLCGMLAAGTLSSPAFAQEVLPSWNDTASKQRIVDFVKATTTEGGEGYVAPQDRIAVFDMTARSGRSSLFTRSLALLSTG